MNLWKTLLWRRLFPYYNNFTCDLNSQSSEILFIQEDLFCSIVMGTYIQLLSHQELGELTYPLTEISHYDSLKRGTWLQLEAVGSPQSSFQNTQERRRREQTRRGSCQSGTWGIRPGNKSTGLPQGKAFLFWCWLCGKGQA